jgi:hypothetical protein
MALKKQKSWRNEGIEANRYPKKPQSKRRINLKNHQGWQTIAAYPRNSQLFCF